jgi:hypothetical protein
MAALWSWSQGIWTAARPIAKWPPPLTCQGTTFYAMPLHNLFYPRCPHSKEIVKQKTFSFQFHILIYRTFKVGGTHIGAKLHNYDMD